MKRYILAMLLTDRNTSFLFDSKRAGGLDQLFEQVGAAIAKIGNENVHECKLTEVEQDFVVGADFTPYGFMIPQPTNQDWVIVKAGAVKYAGLTLDDYKELDRMVGIPHPVLEDLIHPEGPIHKHPARVLSLATMAIRKRSEWSGFFETQAYADYVTSLDMPLYNSPEVLKEMLSGLTAYHTAILAYGVAHEILPRSFLK